MIGPIELFNDRFDFPDITAESFGDQLSLRRDQQNPANVLLRLCDLGHRARRGFVEFGASQSDPTLELTRHRLRASGAKNPVERPKRSSDTFTTRNTEPR